MVVKSDKKRVMITLSDEKLIELERLAKKSGLSKSTLVTLWITEKSK